MAEFPAYQTLHLEYVDEHILEVRMNRPEKRNAMNKQLWMEVGHCFSQVVPMDGRCRCVLLTGSGSIFSSGIDLAGALDTLGGGPEGGGNAKPDAAVRAIGVLREGGAWQRAWRAINLCNKPVIAAIHGGCFGAALEMVCFADIRMCTKDATFQAPEVSLGLAADIGGNQMFPKIIGNDSLLRELQMTGRRFDASEAKEFGLVSRVVPDKDALMAQAMDLAKQIAAKSPTAMLGVKTMLNFTRDHSVEDSLNFGLTWNGAMIQTTDVKRAGQAFMTKKDPEFPDVGSIVDKPWDFDQKKASKL